MDDGFVYIGRSDSQEGRLMEVGIMPTEKLIKNKNYQKNIIKFYAQNKKYKREMPISLDKVISQLYVDYKE
jgi:hypothetical protein